MKKTEVVEDVSCAICHWPIYSGTEVICRDTPEGRQYYCRERCYKADLSGPVEIFDQVVS